MTWLISDEARKHRAFREVWVAYLLGGLYLASSDMSHVIQTPPLLNIAHKNAV